MQKITQGYRQINKHVNKEKDWSSSACVKISDLDITRMSQTMAAFPFHYWDTTLQDMVFSG